MNTKTYLKKYESLSGKVERLRERIEQIEASLQGSIKLDGLPHGTKTSNPTLETAIKLANIRSKLNIAMMEAELTRQTIATEIEEMENPKYRELLYSRYILLMKWDDVAERVSKGRANEYEITHVKGYMHSQALKAFEETRNARTLHTDEDEPR